MNKKKKYEEASVELILLEPSDVIATSALGEEDSKWDKDGWA